MLAMISAFSVMLLLQLYKSNLLVSIIRPTDRRGPETMEAFVDEVEAGENATAKSFLDDEIFRQYTTALHHARHSRIHCTDGASFATVSIVQRFYLIATSPRTQIRSSPTSAQHNQPASVRR